MAKTREVLDAELQELDDRMPALIATEGASELLKVFIGFVDPILDGTTEADRAYANERLGQMLAKHGLQPN